MMLRRMAEIEIALKIALKAHGGVKDRGGNPYILHPLRVAAGVRSEKAKVAAILHDVIEDSNYTAEKLLRKGISPEVVAAVEGVTRREEESYMVFVHRAKRNPISRAVKIADITDNMDLSRIPNPTEEDRARNEKYRKALEILMS